MEETPLRQQRMGKCTHANCRRCTLAKASNNQHVPAVHNLKDSSERRHSEAYICVEPRIRQERRENFTGKYSTKSASDNGSDTQESSINCANSRREYRPEERVRAVGYRGKRIMKSRSRSLAGEKQNTPRFLARSTSCCNVRYTDDTYTSSETESEPSEVFPRAESSCIDTCLECNAKNSLERYRGISSMPNLVDGINSNINTKDCAAAQAGSNHLGLEVMLSLINGPMQSVIDSKDEKIRSLERVIERLECENNQMKLAQKPGDATKIFTLEKTLESCVRQIEQLEEANKTAQEKVRLLEDLRKNDKECIDILRAQTNDLETKLTKSDERVREAEKDGKNQSQWLKEQYEKQVGELQSALRAKETILRDLDKVKSRVIKQKQELEDKRNSESELHAKMCEQVMELKRQLQLHQTRLNILEREKRSLEESLSQSENLQRQDQKSSYVLQMKIVELQEKLDLSYRKNEELDKQREMAEAKRQVLEEKLKQVTKPPVKWQSVERSPNEGIPNLAKVDGSRTKGNKTNGAIEMKPESPERCTTVANRHMNLDMSDVFREKVIELQKKFNKGQQAERVSDEHHVQDLHYYEQQSAIQEKWAIKEDSYDPDNSRRDSMDEAVPVRDIPLKKMELAFTGDKRRPSTDESSSASSSASSSRRGSAESPRTERRQLKVLKVRKVSKENISQFQQNATYMMSLRRQNPCGSVEKLNSNTNRLTAFRQVKDRTLKMRSFLGSIL